MRTFDASKHQLDCRLLGIARRGSFGVIPFGGSRRAGKAKRCISSNDSGNELSDRALVTVFQDIWPFRCALYSVDMTSLYCGAPWEWPEWLFRPYCAGPELPWHVPVDDFVMGV